MRAEVFMCLVNPSGSSFRTRVAAPAASGSLLRVARHTGGAHNAGAMGFSRRSRRLLETQRLSPPDGRSVAFILPRPPADSIEA